MRYLSIGLSLMLGSVGSVAAAERICPNKSTQPEFQVGLSQLSIAPLNTLTLAGYGVYVLDPNSTRKNSEGLHDPIYASALWIQAESDKALVIVSLDLIGVSQPMLRRVQEKLQNLEPSGGIHLILTATHTHHAPDVLGLWGALPFSTGRDDEYLRFLENTIVSSVQVAASHARCSHVFWAESFKETDWHEKLPAGSEREETITTLSIVEAETQTPLGTLTQWAAHPTVLDGKNNTISSDFPGAFRAALQTFRPGIHIYVNGMLGNSHIPVKKDDRRPDLFPEGDHDPDVAAGYEQQSYHGYDLAEKVDQALSLNSHPLLWGNLSWRQHRFALPLSNGLFKFAESFNIIEDRGMARGYVDTEINLIHWGELQLATLPGEMFPSGTGRIRQHLKAGSKLNDPFIFLGIGNDWLGYLLSAKEYDQLKYLYHRGLSPDKNAMDLIVREYELSFTSASKGGVK